MIAIFVDVNNIMIFTFVSFIYHNITIFLVVTLIILVTIFILCLSFMHTRSSQSLWESPLHSGVVLLRGV